MIRKDYTMMLKLISLISGFQLTLFSFSPSLFLSILFTPLLVFLPPPQKNGTIFRLTEVITAHSQLPNTRIRNKHIISPDKKKLCMKRGNIQATSDFSLQPRENKRGTKSSISNHRKKRESFYSFAINHLIKLNNFVIESRKENRDKKKQ